MSTVMPKRTKKSNTTKKKKKRKVSRMKRIVKKSGSGYS